MSVRAGSMPPMTSTTTSMSPRLTRAVASVVISAGSMPSRTLEGRMDGDTGELDRCADACGEVVGVRRHDARHL